MLEIDRSNQFKRDVKLAKKRGKDLDKLKRLILKLANEEALPEKYRDHPLSGNYLGTRECHIEPDWLLIYVLSSNILRLERTGTHSDLFK